MVPPLADLSARQISPKDIAAWHLMPLVEHPSLGRIDCSPSQWSFVDLKVNLSHLVPTLRMKTFPLKVCQGVSSF